MGRGCGRPGAAGGMPDPAGNGPAWGRHGPGDPAFWCRGEPPLQCGAGVAETGAGPACAAARGQDFPLFASTHRSRRLLRNKIFRRRAGHGHQKSRKNLLRREVTGGQADGKTVPESNEQIAAPPQPTAFRPHPSIHGTNGLPSPLPPPRPSRPDPIRRRDPPKISRPSPKPA